jgi:hypothetical protein
MAAFAGGDPLASKICRANFRNSFSGYAGIAKRLGFQPLVSILGTGFGDIQFQDFIVRQHRQWPEHKSAIDDNVRTCRVTAETIGEEQNR